MHVIHVFDKFINSGVHSAASSLHEAIKLTRPDWSQFAVVFSPEGNAGKVCPPWFFMQGVKAGYQPLREILKKPGDRVAIIHRAMRTPVKKMSSHIMACNCPVVVLSHTLAPSASVNAFGPCACIVAVSKKMGSALIETNPKSRLEVIHNFCADSPLRWNQSSSDGIILGRVNSFNQIKHSDKFIRWFRSADFGAPATLRYIGSGSLMASAVDAYEKSSGINSVDFLGWIEGRDNVLKEMSRWNGMLYHINEPEGTSMAVLDAMCLGMPIITSNLPGNNEVIEDGKTGLLFKDFDHARRLILSLTTGDRGISLGAAARDAWVARHSLRAGGEKYCSIIESVSMKQSLKKTTRVDLHRLPGRSTPRWNAISEPLRKCEAFLSANPAYANASVDVIGKNHVCLLVTCKNKGTMLADALMSIFQQTHRNLSVSFVDDASTDGSREVWLKYRPQLESRGIDCRHEFIKKPVGYASALASALAMSPPDVVAAIVDADDAIGAKSCAILSALYDAVPEAGYVWTQFLYCSGRLFPERLGFSSAPLSGKSLLDSEQTPGKKHCYSHWRSFRRFSKDYKIFETDAPSAIDKFMGYRLEEMMIGHFADIPLYLYRSPGRGTMTASGGQAKSWKRIREAAQKRRQSSENQPKGFV